MQVHQLHLVQKQKHSHAGTGRCHSFSLHKLVRVTESPRPPGISAIRFVNRRSPDVLPAQLFRKDQPVWKFLQLDNFLSRKRRCNMEEGLDREAGEAHKEEFPRSVKIHFLK